MSIALLLSSNGRPTVGGEYEIIVVGESAVSISYCQSRTPLMSWKVGAEIVDGIEIVAIDGEN
jgi:hypothetical protein